MTFLSTTKQAAFQRNRPRDFQIVVRTRCVSNIGKKILGKVNKVCMCMYVTSCGAQWGFSFFSKMVKFISVYFLIKCQCLNTVFSWKDWKENWSGSIHIITEKHLIAVYLKENIINTWDYVAMKWQKYLRKDFPKISHTSEQL